MARTKVPVTETINKAHRGHWAVGEFNMNNLETLQAVVRAANMTNSPVIVGVSFGTLRFAGLNYIYGLIQGAHAEARVPLYFHLDHSPDLKTIKDCVAIGFDSVMIDTSHVPEEGKIKLVKETVEYCHRVNVAVEGQIGETWDEEKGAGVSVKTDPALVVPFVEATGVDYLGFSFGSPPGAAEGIAEADLELVRQVGAVSPVPIVLHGGSSIADDFVSQAIWLGVAKVNVDVAIRKTVTANLKRIYTSTDVPADPRVAFRTVREAATQVIMAKMRVFGSSGHAG